MALNGSRSETHAHADELTGTDRSSTAVCEHTEFLGREPERETLSAVGIVR